jgi:hypothetical protein
VPGHDLVTQAGLRPDALLVACAAAAVVALAFVGMRHKGWARVAWLGTSHAIASSVVAFFAVSGLDPPSTKPVLAGAVLYESAYAALVILMARWAILRGAARARRRGARASSYPPVAVAVFATLKTPPPFAQ